MALSTLETLDKTRHAQFILMGFSVISSVTTCLTVSSPGLAATTAGRSRWMLVEVVEVVEGSVEIFFFF